MLNPQKAKGAITVFVVLLLGLTAFMIMPAHAVGIVPVGSAANSDSTSITLPVSSASAVVLVVFLFSYNAYDTVASVAATGVTGWTEEVRYQPASSTTAHWDMEIWYGQLTGSPSSIPISYKVAGSGSIQHTENVAFGLNSLITWDSNAALPGETDQPSAWYIPTASVSTSNPNDFIFDVEAGCSGGLQNAGSGFALIAQASDTSCNIAAQYTTVTSTQSGRAMPFSSYANQGWLAVSEAIVETGTVSSSSSTTSTSSTSTTPTTTTSSTSTTPTSTTTSTTSTSSTSTSIPSFVSSTYQVCYSVKTCSLSLSLPANSLILVFPSTGSKDGPDPNACNDITPPPAISSVTSSLSWTLRGTSQMTVCEFVNNSVYPNYGFQIRGGEEWYASTSGAISDTITVSTSSASGEIAFTVIVVQGSGLSFGLSSPCISTGWSQVFSCNITTNPGLVVASEEALNGMCAAPNFNQEVQVGATVQNLGTEYMSTTLKQINLAASVNQVCYDTNINNGNDIWVVTVDSIL